MNPPRLSASLEENLPARVKEITNGKGARLIFDPIGGQGSEKLADAAAYRGTIVEYGALAAAPTPLPLFTALGKRLTVQGYTVREILSVEELKVQGGEVCVPPHRGGKFQTDH
jgi:NADPH:quinone reductase-like Zn-dependent oxidoreductase